MRELPEIQAGEMLKPLGRVHSIVLAKLRQRLDGYRSDLNGYWNTIHGLVITADQTIQASFMLVGDDHVLPLHAGTFKAYPAQAIMLGRSLLEALGNVMALIEEPRTRDALFRRDGYRESFRTQQRMKASAGQVPKWRAALGARLGNGDRTPNVPLSPVAGRPPRGKRGT